MSETARVQSVPALQDFRASYLMFCEDIKDALTAANSEGQRMLDHVLREQLPRWQRAVRDRQEDVTQAKNALMRKQIVKTADGRTPDCLEEKKALRIAQERQREAEEKVKNCKQWGGHLLPRALDEFTGPSRQLAALVEGDPPSAVVFLDRILNALDAYIHLAPPSIGAAAPIGSSVTPAAPMKTAATTVEPQAQPKATAEASSPAMADAEPAPAPADKPLQPNK
jgi:hypothetical protein